VHDNCTLPCSRVESNFARKLREPCGNGNSTKRKILENRKTPKRVIFKNKRTRMAKDGEDYTKTAVYKRRT